MAREPVPAETLAGAETVTSHGKAYALVAASGGLEVFRVKDGLATPFGGAANRESALRLVEDDASGRAQERADRFFRWLDTTVDAVRESVSGPLLASGYEAHHTGGGCMAWMKALPDETHILICTEGNALDGDPDAAEWIVGRYGNEEGFVAVQCPTPLSDAIGAAERLPVPRDADGEPVDRAFDSVEDAVAGVEAGAAVPGR